MKRIENILKNYTSENEKIFKDTVSMLCNKGVPKGCYQDYTVLMDVLKILTCCEAIISTNILHKDEG